MARSRVYCYDADQIDGVVTIRSMMLEPWSTASAYEPCTGRTIPITYPWPRPP